MGRPKKQRNSPIEQTPYERELPSLIEFALLAAILGPREDPKQAFEKAAKFYERAADFHDSYNRSSPEERANACGDDVAVRTLLDAKLEPYFPKVPRRPEVPTYHDFLRLVVKAKVPADSEKRLRDFFRSKCPSGHDDGNYAANQIETLKKEGFSTPPGKWLQIGTDYLFWRRNQVADRNRENRKGKTKKPLGGT